MGVEPVRYRLKKCYPCAIGIDYRYVAGSAALVRAVDSGQQGEEGAAGQLTKQLSSLSQVPYSTVVIVYLPGFSPFCRNVCVICTVPVPP